MAQFLKSVVPLGDQAALAYLTDEMAAPRLALRAREANPPWLIDVVQAYASVALFFDLDQISFGAVARWIEERARRDGERENLPCHSHRIPCCYEFALDLARVAEATGLTAEAVIRLHTQQEYTVYAIGFCPGFPYLGYLPAALTGVPRLASPRLRVEAGSVGLTGKQTGIYTEERPGGWNIVGRTPLELVNVADGYFPLRTGDQVRFEQIGVEEFERRRGERLAV